jgi:aminoglycoside 3-N-acetyltransferase
MHDELVRCLLELGVRPAGVLMVHSSLKALGQRAGGPAAVIEGLRGALGPDGTLLMPALSYSTVTPEHPFYDARDTPSCVGIIPETYRLTPGVRRSLHPTHSVCAAGPLTGDLLGAHATDRTPCGVGSPFRRLPQVRGQILMLGCGLEPNTSMHAIEELVVPPYLFGDPLVYTMVLEDGSRVERMYTPHNFVGWKQRYDRIGEMLEAPALRVGNVLGARCHLLEAARLWERALEALQDEPLAFVERLERLHESAAF